MKKRWISLLAICTLCAALALALCAACSTGENANDTQQSATPEQTAPVETEPLPDSPTPYETDAGSSADPTDPGSLQPPGEFTFADTLFVGDSRTQGLLEYGNIEGATFFCAVSMNLYKLFDSDIEVPGMGTVGLNDVLSAREYGKIYIMLGLNEMGYPFDGLVSKYREVLSEICQAQPNAAIYIQSVMHVGTDVNSSAEYENNTNINRLNEELAGMADGAQVFYMDINPVFDDENGCLNAEYTRDGIHLIARYYPMWVDWLRTSTPMPPA